MKLERVYYGLRPVQPYLGTKPIGGGEDPYTSEFDFILPPGDTEVKLTLIQDKRHPVVINWGDGSPAETAESPISQSTYVRAVPAHQYDTPGKYTVRITCEPEQFWGVGTGYYYYPFVWKGSKTAPILDWSNTILVEARLGENAILYKGAFSGSKALTKVTGMCLFTVIDGTNAWVTTQCIPDYLFEGCIVLDDVSIPPDVTSIMDRAFYNCSSLTSVTIPEGVTSIGESVFYGCSGLTSVVIPAGVTSIGDGAFEGCSGMTSVTIPSSVTSIGASAFYGCSGLTSVTIPDSVTSIGAQMFDGCTSLASVTIPDSVTSIGDSAFFNCSGLTSVALPDSVTSIGSWAFSNCSGLTSVTIPAGVTGIKDYTFYNCSGLTSVTIPDSVTSIGNSAFSGCTSLTSVTIPDSVTSIGSWAFSGCSGLRGVTIGSGVTSIGNSAFRSTNISSITCEAQVPPTIEQYTFLYVPFDCPIYVPAASVTAYKTAQYWSARAEYIQAKPT